MVFFMLGLVMLLGCWIMPVHAQTATFSMAWDYGVAPIEGWYVLRCTVPAGSMTCAPLTDLPGMPLAANIRAYIDRTALQGETECWGVQPKGLDGQGRGDLSNVICKRILLTKPPPATNLREVTAPLTLKRKTTFRRPAP
jgi:hypothetical protein